MLRARLASFLRNLFDRRRVDRDLDDELRAYVEMAADEKRDAGWSEADARRAALADMRGLQQVTERVRTARTGASLDQLWQDLSYAMRTFGRNRGFTAASVLTLALGIGASTAIFTIVDTVVYRPLPYEDPDRLVKICGNAARIASDDMSYADMTDILEGSDVFANGAADDGMAYGVTIDGVKQTVLGAMVTTSWLPTLGVRPALGRGFLPEDAVPGRNRVMILTSEYWRRAFGADPSVVGRTLAVEGVPHTIIGVLPPNVVRYESDFLLPLTPAAYPVERGHRDLDVLARLRPGVTLARAQAALDTIARSRECLIRAALGASRSRLIRQLLVENVLLFLAGGALGLAMAGWALDSLHGLAVASGYVPQRLGVAIDARVFAFTAAVSLVTGVVFGLAPALRASRVDLNQGLRDSSGTVQGSRRQRRGRRALIVAELALSLVLLTAFGLLARSFAQVQASASTFAADRIIETSSEGGREFGSAVVYWRAAIEHAEAIPGIEAAAVTSRPPVRDARSRPFTVVGRPGAAGPEILAGDILVSGDYFRTLGIPLLEGRTFGGADTSSAPPVVIVSRSLARRFFPGASPIGRRIVIDEENVLTCCAAPAALKGVEREIVGVVDDIRQANLDEAPALTMYRPFTQIVEHDMYLLLRARTAADAARITPGLRARLLAGGLGKEWGEVRLMRDSIRASESIRLRRFVLLLLGGFAAIAIVLAAVGLYGVMAYSVAERRREIGIRAALGATRQRLLRDVIGEAVRLALAALVVGAIAAQLVTRVIATMLFGVGRSDVLTYLAVWVVLAAVTVTASYLPARRAASLDPVEVLKT